MTLRRFISISILLGAFVLFFFQNTHAKSRSLLHPQNELWQSSLSSVDTVEKSVQTVKVYMNNQHGSNDERIVNGIDAFVRDRFIHGVSHTPARENWIIATLGSALPYGLSVPVDAESILRHRRAMCSQQSIVFMELLSRFGIHYAAVRFVWPNIDPDSRGHFAVAAKVDGNWRYYDSDLEAHGSPLVRDMLNGKAVAATYPGNPWWAQKMEYAAKHNGIIVNSFDEHPGPRGLLLQHATALISRNTSLILIIFALLILYNKFPGVWRTHFAWVKFLTKLRRNIREFN